MQQAELWGYRPENSNPCAAIRRYRQRRSERFLTPEEYRRLAAALDRHEARRPPHVAAVRLLLLTGCRKSEILTLQWSSYREGRLYLSDSKTGPRTVWLCEAAHGVLDRLVEERPSRRQQADVIRLLLLTGCRAGEILKLQCSEVDGDRLNLAETKTGPRTVWLSQAAQTILAHQPRASGPYVFPSPRHPDKPLSDTLHVWWRARKEAGLDDVHLHDLRHTVASQAASPGAFRSPPSRGCWATPTPG